MQKKPTVSITVLPVKKKKQINFYFFYILLLDFIWFYELSSFRRHQTNFGLWISNRVDIITEKFIFYALFLVFFAFLRWIKFCSCCFRQGFFFILVSKKVVAGRVRQVVVLYSNNWTRICLGRFSIGSFTEVVVWTGLTVML